MPSTMSSYTPIDHSDAVGTVVHGTGYNVNTPHNEPSHDRARPRAFSREDEQSLQDVLPTKKAKEVVTWRSLPHKRQLTILTLARLSEPLVQSSLRVSPNPAIGLARSDAQQSYLFYQLKSFDRTLPDSVIASQAGVMQGAFAAAQLCTAMLWGRWSDRRGRKRILLIGLMGTMISSVGFGFSTTFWQALIFRMMGGALNGNVGVMRTMISEIIREKK